MDRTLDAVKDMGLTGHMYLEGFVVLIATHFALSHIDHFFG
jgi:hypothetical protein